MTNTNCPSTVTPPRVAIPVEFYAELTADGTAVTRFVVTPSASYAGHFGPAAEVLDDEAGVLASVDLDGTDGPFWRAVQTWLGENLLPGATVPIHWEE